MDVYCKTSFAFDALIRVFGIYWKIEGLEDGTDTWLK